MNEQLSIPLSTTAVTFLVGFALSAGLRYIPKLDVAWETLDPQKKQLVMLALTLLAPFVIVLGGCINLWSTTASCDQGGFTAALALGLTMLTGSQVGHLTLPKRESVVAAARNNRFGKQFGELKEVPGLITAKLEVINLNSEVVKGENPDDKGSAG